MPQRMGAVVIGLGLLLQGCAILTSLKGQVVDTSAGHVRAYEGKVVALRVGASEPEGLDLDSKVFVGDVVRTQENSRCRIALKNGTVRVVSLQEGIPGEVVLQPGEGTNIELGKPPAPPSRWPAERVERVKQATSLP